MNIVTIGRGTTRQLGRITAGDVKPLAQRNATVFICGSAAFADTATERALEAGVESQAVHVERFGPTT